MRAGMPSLLNCEPSKRLSKPANHICSATATHSSRSTPVSPKATSNLGHSPSKRQAASRGVAVAMHNYYNTMRNNVYTKVATVACSASYAGTLGETDDELVVDLDWKPQLPVLQEIGSSLVALGMAALVYKLAAAKTANLMFQGGAVVAAAIVVWSMLRHVLLEQMYKARQRLEAELGDADSEFRQVHNLRVHVKVKNAAQPATPRPLAIHCFHGFGANTFSWSLVQEKLAQRLGALVSAHDMPGFGLTERPRGGGPGYMLSFNGHLGRAVMDKELAMRGMLGTEELHATLRKYQLKEHAAPQAPGEAPPAAKPSRIARVLVGHSLGGCCAALEALSSPGEIAAVVLVAPAILCFRSKGGKDNGLEPQPLTPRGPPHTRTPGELDEASTAHTLHPTGPQQQQQGSAGGPVAAAAVAGSVAATTGVAGVVGAGLAAAKQEAAGVPEDSAPGASAVDQEAPAAAPQATITPVLRRYVSRGQGLHAAKAEHRAFLAQLLVVVLAFIQGAALWGVLAVLVLMRPLLLVVLRTAVRSRAFWQGGLQAAYHNKSLVDSKVVDGYRKPQLVRGFDTGFINFLLSRLSLGGDLPRYIAAATAGGFEDQGLADRFAHLAAEQQLPVLIVHGDQDLLVPSSNSARLARLIPGCELVAISGCGHMPHEELPDEFVDVVESFLRRSGLLGARVD